MPLVRSKSGGVSANAAPASSQGLASASAAERWSAARSVEAPADVAALGAALALEREANVREAIFTALARIQTQESAAVAASYLSSDEASLRAGALDALRAMPQAAAPLVPQLLADSDPDVRLLASELVRVLEPEEGQRWLCQLLEREEQPNVCAAAVEVLVDIGDAAALATLSRCAARFSGVPFLTFAIAAADEALRARSSSP